MDETPGQLRGIYVILSLCNFVVGLGAFSVIGMIEPLAEGLGVDIAQAGALLTVYSVGFALSAPVLVALTGSVGRRRVVTFGMALCGLATLAAALAPTIAWMYPLRMLAAAGASMVTPVSLAIAAALAPAEGRGKALSAVFLGITVSQVAGVPLGSWLAYTFGFRTVLFLAAVLALPCIWLVWTRVPAGLRFSPVGLRDLGRALRDPVALMALSFTVVFLCAYYVLYTYLPPLLSQTLGLERDGIALALFLFGLPAPLANVLGGWLSDRQGPIRTLALLCLALIPVMGAFGALPLPVPLVFAMVFAWSLLAWMFSPPQQARLVALSPPMAPVLLSLHAASIYVGIASGSALGGVVLRAGGVLALGPAAACLALAALAVLLVSHRAARVRAG